MASSEQQQASSFIERLISSRNRDISHFLPFALGLNATSPFQETENQESPDGIILINPITQGVVVIERRGGRSDGGRGSSVDFDHFLNDLFTGKGGRSPASKASIDAMATVEVVEIGEQCVICLEEWEHGQKAKEMPCGHRFHGECVEKWLRIHGSCPVCRYGMPVEKDGDGKRSGDGEGERRREIWMSFVFSRGTRTDGADDFEESHQEMQR